MKSNSFVYDAKTKWGVFKFCGSENGISSFHFPKERLKPSKQMPSNVQKIFKKAHSQLNSYIRNGVFDSNLKLDESRWSKSRRKMSRALSTISKGKTSSYAELAKACRIPKGPRAIGQLLGSNPLPIFVPCCLLSTN